MAVTRTRGVGLIATGRVPPPNGFEAFKLEPLERAASESALQALLAFVFGAVFFKEAYALTKLSGAIFVVVGVAFLRV